MIRVIGTPAINFGSKLLFIVAGMAAVVLSHAQSPALRPEFKVASVKSSDPKTVRKRGPIPSRRPIPG
jgi:hypothetical protein